MFFILDTNHHFTCGKLNFFQNVCKIYMIVDINKLVSPKGLNNLKLKHDLDFDNLKIVSVILKIK